METNRLASYALSDKAAPYIVVEIKKPLTFPLLSSISMAVQSAFDEAGLKMNITIREVHDRYQVIIER